MSGTPVENRTIIGATVLVVILLLAVIGVQLQTAKSVALLLTAVNKAAEQAQEPAAWEYDVVSIGDTEWNTKGQELGYAGWEIIATRRASGADDQFLYECIVRRKLAK